MYQVINTCMSVIRTKQKHWATVAPVANQQTVDVCACACGKGGTGRQKVTCASFFLDGLVGAGRKEGRKERDVGSVGKGTGGKKAITIPTEHHSAYKNPLKPWVWNNTQKEEWRGRGGRGVGVGGGLGCGWEMVGRHHHKKPQKWLKLGGVGGGGGGGGESNRCHVHGTLN